MARPASVLKSRLLATATNLTADSTDSTVHDTRGMSDMYFAWSVTAAAGGTADTNYFKGKVLGCNTSTGTFVEVPGLTTGQFIAATTETTPTAANAPGVVMPRFIKIQWDETGTITDFDATCRLYYTRERGNAPPGSMPSSAT
jgi:hypothetical protein